MNRRSIRLLLLLLCLACGSLAAGCATTGDDTSSIPWSGEDNLPSTPIGMPAGGLGGAYR